ncbi:hypothetical protein D3C80_2147110 [compost metagenome]
MILTGFQQRFAALQMMMGIVELTTRQRAFRQHRQTLQLLLRLEVSQHAQPLTGGFFGVIKARPRPQQL